MELYISFPVCPRTVGLKFNGMCAGLFGRCRLSTRITLPFKWVLLQICNVCCLTLRDSFTHIVVSLTSTVAGIRTTGRDEIRVHSSFSIPAAMAAGSKAAAVNTELYPTGLDLATGSFHVSWRANARPY